MIGFAEPVIGPARGPHRVGAMGLPRFGPDPLAQPILRAVPGRTLSHYMLPSPPILGTAAEGLSACSHFFSIDSPFGALLYSHAFGLFSNLVELITEHGDDDD